MEMPSVKKVLWGSIKRNEEKCVGKVLTTLLAIRVQTMLNHISICFLPQYQPQRKFFSQSAS